MPADIRRALRVQEIHKSYPGVHALRGVSLDVRAGEVHAVVGENGAGKSTLMGVISGSQAADAGTIEIAGTSLDRPSPAATRALGLVIAHQWPALAPDLTVVENMTLAAPRAQVDDRVAWCREALAAVHATASPHDRVHDLSLAQRQLVEVAKAYVASPRLLILDEPTEPLSATEIDNLFAWVERLAADGVGVIYISHRIPEIRRIADRVTVLRDGMVAGSWTLPEISDDEIVHQVVGRPVEAAFADKPKRAARDTPILAVDDFSCDGFADVSLSVHAGEVVGLAGVEGNGQRELLHALAGVAPSRQAVVIDGVQRKIGDVRAARRHGIVYLPADRHDDGLFMRLSVRENLALSTLGERRRGGFVRRGAEREAVNRQIERLDVRAASSETEVATLSGGNQQKVLIGAAMMAGPRVFLLEDPTQGVDVGARAEIYRSLRALAADGAAVLIVSSDPIELEGLCDRVLVFARGRVVAELCDEQVTEHEIAQAALMVAAAREPGGSGSAKVRFLRGDYFPSLVLAGIIVALGAFVASRNGLYLSGQNVRTTLALLAALAFIALGQLVVVQAGGFDLSVGPLSGLIVVVGSFYFAEPLGAGALVLGLLIAATVAFGAGLLNGVMAGPGGISPIVTTLVTFILFQGCSLLLRPTPGGTYDIRLSDALTTAAGPLPVSFAVAVAIGIALEWWLRRTRSGMALRAVGSDDDVARRLGLSPERVRLYAYLGCAGLTFCGSLVLAGQVGIGDPNLGTEYTLMSITAVVLGGASIFGGRGSFVGAMLGALLIVQVMNATTFLGLDDAWQRWLVGLMTLSGAGVYSRLRATRTSP
ncbi:ATP-binding cassette domain-containing protein [Actinomadura spongiicola]|uniref:ATP-binding cassette domain-containing protein n=1 Tax=Actinomadura spongiicola TaxID=2303421 RepID=A0A372GFZ5_9ACTN|nr:ATP-binding cassette domain-containing protein [Actinomadura spongiicola]RFS84290.1 ATP-binding cassette domain-containing protein [Actinomadura spongiicola]